LGSAADGRIVRVWRGFGTVDGVERYCHEHLTPVVLPRLRTLDGFLGARVLVRAAAGETEVVVITSWVSLDAIRAFAGEDYTSAVVEPVVSELLTRFDAHVSHYSVAVDLLDI
jgi:hypothetical protein